MVHKITKRLVKGTGSRMTGCIMSINRKGPTRRGDIKVLSLYGWHDQRRNPTHGRQFKDCRQQKMCHLKIAEQNDYLF